MRFQDLFLLEDSCDKMFVVIQFNIQTNKNLQYYQMM